MFMDVIRLPHRTEDLAPRQIQKVNRLRRPLIDDRGSRQHATNRRVKRAMADGLVAAGVTGVLDWGCGYHPLRPYLPRDVALVGVDIDPEVVAENRRLGLECYDPEDAALQYADRPPSALVSVFVFHFRLPTAHIAAMAELVGTDGFLLANVYRRDEQSRGRLVTAFRERGLQVTREKDPTEAATGHEFWFLARPRVTGNLADKVLHTVLRGMA
ncbi:class I SAM-dependent methyltransferase [Jidongwangia harbinensis]|uniref:class I SAM-dependent methyltransferase n=1 Tax=Jidongwangia harbinensis TaxID=2878561 RepID=UPI001CDA1BA7|nr:class I SAM-dependent methyltransferase [Jidongwangia harbinensis]MCA2217836.1 class I SAM-dependent methyltransferase [Jidongwangia harbinensis]